MFAQMLSPFDYAVHYLSRYPKTAHELHNQLRKKGYDEEEIGQTLTRLISQGSLDDRSYAKLYLGSEVVRKGKSLALILAKLRQKGVDQAILHEIVEEMEEELTEGTITKLHKEIGKLKTKGLGDLQIVQKLASRGYRIDQIRRLLTAQDE